MACLSIWYPFSDCIVLVLRGGQSVSADNVGGFGLFRLSVGQTSACLTVPKGILPF